ncbi:MAG: hypothetical protein RRB13_05810 [bacterium]|nr:hypothetical protein [bacterium]
MLAPWFGLSDSGAALTSVLLLAAGLGAWLGGWAVEHRPQGLLLTHNMTALALACLAVPSLRAGLSSLFGQPSLLASPWLASILLFGLPAAAGGFLMPLLLRLGLLWQGDRALGAGLGRLLGKQLLGCWLGYWLGRYGLLPWLRIDGIFLGLGLIWGVLACWGYVLWAPGRFSKGNLSLLAVLAGLLATSGGTLARLPLPEGVAADLQGPDAR